MPVAQMTLAALREETELEVPLYGAALFAACAARPPPFGTAWYAERYRALARDPSWLAASLVANAQKEGEGARWLWELSGRTSDPFTAECLRMHAVDESRHALFYLAILDAAFPAVVDAGMRAQLQTLSPRFGYRERPAPLPPEHPDVILDELVQMNLGEIRTRTHIVLLRQMIGLHCAAAGRDTAHRLLDKLLADVTRHLAYTARLLENAIAAGKGELIELTLVERLEEFNQATLSEVGEDRFLGD
jgi:hypothetical protein